MSFINFDPLFSETKLLRSQNMCYCIILKAINHMLERGSKVFGCFLNVRKAFGTVWIDGLLYKLFTELGIEGKMWLALN